MFGYLTLAALLFGAADRDVRIKAPASPFECAHARSFAFDKAGRRLTCITQRGELLACNINGGSPVVTALEKKPGGGIFDRAPISAVVAGSGADVVLFYLDGRVQVWNIDTRRKVKDLESDRKGFGYAHASPDGRLAGALSNGREGKSSALLFWNARDWTTAGRIETKERINDFCFTASGRRVLACVGHPTDQKHLGFTGIVAWDLESKKELSRIEYGSGFPIRIAVSPDGRWVATGGGDAVPIAENARRLSGHLRIFDWEDKKFVVEPYTLASDYVRAVQFSPDSKYLYSGSYSAPPAGGQYIAAIKAYRAGDWVCQWDATLGNGNPHEVCVSPNGKDILVPDSSKLQLVDAKDGNVRGAILTFRSYWEEGDEERLRSARYAVPDGGVGDLAIFIQTLFEHKPKTPQEDVAYRVHFRRAVGEAAEKILKLDKDPNSEACQAARFVLLANRVYFLAQGDPQQRQKTLAEVRTYLEEQVKKGDAEAGASLAILAGRTLEQMGQRQLAADTLQRFAAIVAKSGDGNLSGCTKEMLQTAQRLAAAAKKLPDATQRLVLPPKGKLIALDFQGKATWYLDTMTPAGAPAGASGSAAMGNGVTELPRGEHNFSGVKFRVGGKFIQLSGKPLPSAPVSVEGIPVGRKIAALYVLQGAQKFSAREGVPAGEYRIRYEDGSSAVFPVVYGVDVRDWWNRDNLPVTRGMVVWTGGNLSAQNLQATLRLYLGAWKNPHPQKKVISLDFVSSRESDSAPFCVAMTVEEPVSGVTAPVSSRPIALHDGFRGKLELPWKIVRADASHYSLTKNPGRLTVTTQRGTIHGDVAHDALSQGTLAKNIFVVPNPCPEGGDFRVTLAVSRFQPTAAYHQVALLCYNDDANYLKWSFEYDWSNPGSTRFILVRQTDKEPQHDLTVRLRNSGRLWLRITKSGDEYQCAYSTDGREFKVAGTLPWGDRTPKYIGFLAKNGGVPDAAEIDAVIDSFDLVSPPHAEPGTPK